VVLLHNEKEEVKMKLNRKMFLCGDMIDIYKCDCCGREQDSGSWPGHIHWKKQNFTICRQCLKELAKENIPELREEWEWEEKNNNNYRKKHIQSDLRWQVWGRDNFTCQECGSRKCLTIDHIFPESKGGKTELNNLQTLCKKCNNKKGVK